MKRLFACHLFCLLSHFFFSCVACVWLCLCLCERGRGERLCERGRGERLFLRLSLSLLTFTSAFHLFLSHTRARALSLCLCLARLFEAVLTSLVVTTEHRHTVSGHKLLVHAALRGLKLLGYAVLSLLVSLSQRNTRHSSPTLIPAPEFNAHLQTAGVWVTGRVGVWVCG